MRESLFKVYLSAMAFFFCIGLVHPVFATDLDGLASGNSSYSSQTNNSTSQGSSANSNNSITGYLKGYTPVTDDNMKNAQVYASPIVNLLGTLTGFLIMIVSAGIFTITGLDLMYIGIPPVRKMLNPDYGGGSAGGMGGMGSQPQASGRSRLVSDEAVACVAMAGQQGGGGGGMSQGGGFGGGGFGGGGFGGGMGMQQPQQQSQGSSTKSTITLYLKKRTVFLVVFAVAMIVLTSSILLDCGINLGMLSLKIISKFSGIISGINI